MKVFTIFTSIFLMIFLSCTISPPKTEDIILIKGSDTMLILMEKLSSEYMKANPGISIYTEGGGTASGVQALLNGEVNICAGSRPLKPEEISRFAEKYSTVSMSFRVAKDALSVYVNPDNPVKDLTLKQLKQIFTGEVSNWKMVGGNDAPIMVLIRPPNSGTHLYFKEHILENENYLPAAITIPTTEQIVQQVLRNIAAIGYGGIAYGPGEIHCRVNGIPPSEPNVRYDLYPISRYLYLYTIRKPTGIPRKFIDWVLSSDGQRLVEEVGYIPLFPE